MRSGMLMLLTLVTLKGPMAMLMRVRRWSTRQAVAGQAGACPGRSTTRC
jgi:hypothetical protein